MLSAVFTTKMIPCAAARMTLALETMIRLKADGTREHRVVLKLVTNKLVNLLTKNGRRRFKTRMHLLSRP